MNQLQKQQRPIGVFDSGIGGLSVLRHITKQLPNESILYVADQAHVPYGNKSADEIQQRCRAITDFLLTAQCKMVVIACNTATATALSTLRMEYPQLPFVGTEPAIKPGAKATNSGHVGILARAGTFKSQRYASLMKRYATDVILHEDPCDGLVELIENGQLNAPEMSQLLTNILTPMLANQVDTFVLGCTHYPFVKQNIRTLVGNDIQLIDPAPAVAKQVDKLLKMHHLSCPTADANPTITAYTTANADQLHEQIKLLIHQTIRCQSIPY